MQPFFDLFIFTDAVHISGGSFAHHQEHITVHTASDMYSYVLPMMGRETT
jgi:hypothetical protein